MRYSEFAEAKHAWTKLSDTELKKEIEKKKNARDPIWISMQRHHDSRIKQETDLEEARGEVIGQHPSGIDVMITKARDKVTKKPTRNVVLVDTNSGKKTVILRSVKSEWDTGDIVDHIKSVHGNKFRGFSFNVNETIRKKGSKWVIYSKDGDKKLGTYDTKSAAQKRLGQIEYFKHNESVSEGKDYKAGDRVTVRNIKTKRNKTYTVAKVRDDGKLETTSGKIIYPSDIEPVGEAELKVTSVAGNKVKAGDGVEIDLDQVDLDVEPTTRKIAIKPKGTKPGAPDPKTMIKPGSTINIGDK